MIQATRDGTSYSTENTTTSNVNARRPTLIKNDDDTWQ